jgi:hypothetical protein
MYKVFMIRVLCILFLFFGHGGLNCFSQNENNNNRLRELVRKYGQADVIIPLTDNRSLDILTRNSSILSVRDKRVYISLSPRTIEWFIQQKYDFEIIDNTGGKNIITASDLNDAMEWDKYPAYSQYDSIMQSFAENYPDICRLDTIGTSINGKLVLALKISDNPADDEDEPAVFYTSTIHGDETGGFVLMLRLADYLLKNYDLDTRVSNLADNLEIWINPLSNPDGTYGTGNLIISPTRYNANGVDLNRNFPDPFQPEELQQKENTDMIKFMRKHKFALSANFHSGAEVVNYPWDRWLSKYHADNLWFNAISRAYADTVHTYAGPAYMNDLDNGVTRGSEWYVIYGGRQDFVTGELQGREVTIELDYIKITPAAQLELLWQYNQRSLLGYLENALYGIHGRVRDSGTKAPVAAKIFIEAHDKDGSHVYSDSLSGSFVRFLEPGIWDLTFSAEGYISDTLRNIAVFQGQKTLVEIDLIPGVNSIDTANPDLPLLYPNPATTEIYALLPEGVIGNVNITILDQSGRVVSENITEVTKGVPVRVSLLHFPGGVYSVIFENNRIKGSFHSRFIVIK